MTRKINFQIKLLLFVLIYFNSCINLKIELPEEPGFGIDYLIITNMLNKNSEYEKPLSDEKVFSTDETIFSILKILNVEKKSEICWYWYGPDKKLVRISSKTDVNIQNNYLEYFVVWDSMDRSIFKDRKGNWTVAIMIEGKFLTEKKFKIN